MMTNIFFGVFGVSTLIGVAFLFSSAKKQVNWQLVFSGVLLQIILATLVILTHWGAFFFNLIGKGFISIINFSNKGSEFIFGELAQTSKNGFILAFQVLPTIIFFSTLMSILYHLGIMQKIVQGLSWIMRRTMKISGAESCSIAANVFVGQTEAPLVVSPYISGMTLSELLTLMTGGMATIAGGVLAVYIGLLAGNNPELQIFYARHLLSASLMSAPAAVVIAKILLPETVTPLTSGMGALPSVATDTSNIIDAAAAGAKSGLKLALNVGAMLLAFVALIEMCNSILSTLGELSGFNSWYGESLNLSLILGYLLSPLSWCIGIPWQDSVLVGGLIGKKIVVNEFVAYIDLSKLTGQLTAKSQLIATYALCGFANFSSIAIQIGGISSIAPNRRSDLAKYGLRAVLGGLLATLMTAAIAGAISTIP